MSLNLVGTKHGQFEVLERAFSKNKKVFWDVRCISCDCQYQLPTDAIKKNMHGCATCVQRVGINSIYWKGGKYISYLFMGAFRRGAEKRGIEFNVTVEELDEVWEAQDGKCAYSGVNLIIGNRKSVQTASLDRIDSKLGYFKDNVQFVHKDVNILKWDFTEERFLELIGMIAKNRGME